MRMIGTGIYAQMGELMLAERSTRQHPLHRLLDNALWRFAGKIVFGTALLDAADIAGVIVKDLVLTLIAREQNLLGIDHDNIVPAIQMRRVHWLVLAA